MLGWSWQRGESELQGSLYWEVLRALAAIWLVRLGWRPMVPGPGLGRPKPGGPGPGRGFGDARGCGACAPNVETEGHRGDEGTFLEGDFVLRVYR